MFETDLEKDEETNTVCQLNQIFSNSETAILSLTIAEYVRSRSGEGGGDK